MENFSGNLARSLPYLKRDSHRYKRSTENILPPYTIITPNIGEETNISLCWLEFMRNFKRYGVEITTTATSLKKMNLYFMYESRDTLKSFSLFLFVKTDYENDYGTQRN